MKSYIIQCYLALLIVVCPCADRLAWAWSGELDGELNGIYIQGAGSVDSLEGVSLLGNLRYSPQERGVFQLKVPTALLSEQRIDFGSVDQNDSLNLAYQLYTPNGRLIFSATAESGWLVVTSYGPNEFRFECKVSLVDRNQRIEIQTESLRLTNPFPTLESVDVEERDRPSGEIVYVDDEGCDYDDYEESESEGISCESDDQDDDLESDDGCTDDDWAAEASLMNRSLSHRRYLKQWRMINRLMPFLFSLCIIFFWRRVGRSKEK